MIVHEFWFEIPKHFQHVRLDVFVVMPNHVHGILLIGDREGGNTNADAERGGGDPIGVKFRNSIISVMFNRVLNYEYRTRNFEL